MLGVHNDRLENKALPPLQSIKFGARDDMNHLIQVIQGGDSGEGLALAADLALGVERLCARLDVAINDGEDPVRGPIAQPIRTWRTARSKVTCSPHAALIQCRWAERS